MKCITFKKYFYISTCEILSVILLGRKKRAIDGEKKSRRSKIVKLYQWYKGNQ